MSKRLSVTPFYMRRCLASSRLLQASGSSPPRPGCRRAAATSAVAVRDRVGGRTHDCARCPFRAVSATQKARRAPALQTRLRGHSERTVREHPVRLIVCISEFHWQRLEILKKKKRRDPFARHAGQDDSRVHHVGHVRRVLLSHETRVCESHV